MRYQLIEIKDRIKKVENGYIHFEKYPHPVKGSTDVSKECEYFFCIKEWLNCNDDICKAQLWDAPYCEMKGIPNEPLDNFKNELI